MKNTTRIGLLGWVLSWLLVPSSSLAAPSPMGPPVAYQEEQEERFSRNFDMGTEGSFTLTNVSGEIVVRGGSGGQLQVDAVKRVHGARRDADARRQLDAVDIEVSQMGNRVRIHTRYGDRDERGDRDINVSVDYRVTVPPGTEVSVKSVSGDVDVEGVQGELEAESVSGEVTIRDAETLALAKSVSGNVTVISTGGSRFIEISSVSGDVDARQLRAQGLELQSVSGDVEVTDASCERADLNTVSGDVRYSGTLAPSGRYDFKSHSGDVRITIPGDVGFELEASSFSGGIESDFALTVAEMRRERRISGVFGDGSAVINATTFSGDIIITQK